MKRCFQKERSIKSIKDLEYLYESKILSKSKYRFKAEESSFQTINSNNINKKKAFIDKIPTNILAAG
jgi:hypothetical protein